MDQTLVPKFLRFLDQAPTPWHAAAEAGAALRAAGFLEVDERAPAVAVEAGQRAFVLRSGSIVAWVVGQKAAEESGFRLVSAHTDSPNLRIRPQPLIRSHGYVRLGVEVYGGVLQATWTDRDLGLAGQVFVRSSAGQTRRLVDLRRPLCRVPNVAIHLNRAVNDEGLKLNPHTQLPAVLGLDRGEADPLRAALAAELEVEASDVLTWDLCLYDVTHAAVGGLDREFIYSGRLDNLGSSHAALEALLRGAPDRESTAVIALFDHEEVGSTSARGATSRLLVSVLERLAGAPGLSRALANSWHLSVDMAHAVHPGWADRHDAAHMPVLNGGPVIKQNSSQRYGTEAETAALLLRVMEGAGVAGQWFVNRADLACGTTVGPIVAAELGIRTADLGNPMLSMHSIREMCGREDHARMVDVLAQFMGPFVA